MSHVATVPQVFDVEMLVTVRVVITDPNVIDRCVLDENGWRTKMFYDLATRDEVLEHLAYNAISNGVDRASALDGWADIGPEVCTMEITDASLERVS